LYKKNKNKTSKAKTETETKCFSLVIIIFSDFFHIQAKVILFVFGCWQTHEADTEGFFVTDHKRGSSWAPLKIQWDKTLCISLSVLSR